MLSSNFLNPFNNKSVAQNIFSDKDIENAHNFFADTASSSSWLAAKKFFEKYIVTGQMNNFSFFDTPENIIKLSEYISGIIKKLHPAAHTEEVIDTLRNAGIITEPIKEKKQKVEKVFQEVKTEYFQLSGIQQAEISQDQLKIIEANLLDEEIAKANIFKNQEELERLYKKTSFLESINNTGSLEYYTKFAERGLLKNGEEEAKQDFESLQKTKELFTQKQHPEKDQQRKLEQAKKIATLTERALVFLIDQVKCFGDEVKMNLASEFDDIKRGVDSTLEIVKHDESSDFLGLGIDVTFRGLESEEFRQKFFGLLSSIQQGYKTKIKYGMDYQGNLLSEFIVPKILICFQLEDVKELVLILQNSENIELFETFYKNPQKLKIMKQIIHQCRILSEFAENSQNSVFRRYDAMINSLTELSWKYPEIKNLLEDNTTDPVSNRLNELLVDFSKLEKPL